MKKNTTKIIVLVLVVVAVAAAVLFLFKGKNAEVEQLPEEDDRFVKWMNGVGYVFDSVGQLWGTIADSRKKNTTVVTNSTEE